MKHLSDAHLLNVEQADSGRHGRAKIKNFDEIPDVLYNKPRENLPTSSKIYESG